MGTAASPCGDRPACEAARGSDPKRQGHTRVHNRQLGIEVRRACGDLVGPRSAVAERTFVLGGGEGEHPDRRLVEPDGLESGPLAEKGDP